MALQTVFAFIGAACGSSLRSASASSRENAAKLDGRLPASNRRRAISSTRCFEVGRPGIPVVRVFPPGRLARNQKLASGLSAGLSSTIVPGRETPAMTIPIDPEKVGELSALIAKGLLWHHWQVLLAPDAFGVRAEMLSAAGEQFYNEALVMNSGARVGETLGNGTFSYEGAQSAETPELSVWRFSAFGGLTLSGDLDAPGEISTLIGAMTASNALLARLKAMESPEHFAGAEG